MRNPALRKTVLGLAATVTSIAASAQATGSHVTGDVGAALYRTPAITRTAGRSNVVLPYIYAEAGRFYGRVDTFGYEALPIGMGHLELAARVSFEGFAPANAAFDKRSTPLPIGIGTFQETPFGAFILYGFHDLESGGTLLDVSYAAELGKGTLHVYPQVGFERRSATYVRHLYGVSTPEAARAATTAYAPGASVSPNAAIAVDYAFAPTLKLTGQVRRRWLDTSITGSPLVNARTQTSALIALTRTFR